MSDPQIGKWKQRGKIYLWQYIDNIKNYPGWNFAADEKACMSLINLIDLMKTATWPSSIILNISAPTPKILKVPNNKGGNARWKTVGTFKLKYPKDQVDPDCWLFSLDSTKHQIQLTLGRSWLEALQQGIVDINKGKGDFSINPTLGNNQDEPLWFWWLNN
jgi:hypothetical protein